MPNWRKRTRALEKQKLRLMTNSNNPQGKKSRWALRRFRKDEVQDHEMWGSSLWRKNQQLKRKNNQKRFRSAMEEISKSDYIIDCRYHPCKITKLDVDHDCQRIDYECESLVDQTPNSCSYFHCGVEHIGEEEALERVEMINNLGMYPYQLVKEYRITDPEIARRAIQEMIEMENIWGFNSKGPQTITEEGKVFLIRTYNLKYEEMTSGSNA